MIEANAPAISSSTRSAARCGAGLRSGLLPARTQFDAAVARAIAQAARLGWPGQAARAAERVMVMGMGHDAET